MFEITVFTTPSCVQCGATKRLMDSLGIEYTTVDLTQDPESLARVKSLGYGQAPVVFAGNEDHWSGFQPEKIRAYAPVFQSA